MKALVTGATSGIGQSIARKLAKRGWELILTGRNESMLREMQTTIGKGTEIIAADLSKREEVFRVYEFCKGKDVDMLVNNAGVGNNVTGDTAAIPFYELPMEAFRTVVETNFVGYYLVSRAMVPIMVGQGRGKIVNVSTSDRTMTMKGMLPYGPSRAASDAMSRILAQELAPIGITVNILCPGGATDTGMTTDAIRADMGDRLLPPTVLNEAILYLASPMSDGITGEKLTGKDFRKWLSSRLEGTVR